VAFEDIKDATSAELQLFATVAVYDSDAETTATLYWSEGDVTTDQVDGTMRTWEGRIDGWEIAHEDPPIGAGTYPPPHASLSVWVGANAGDNADDLWDSLTDDHVWDKGAVTVYLVDMSQASGNGARTELIGEVRDFARRLRPNDYTELNIEGLLYQVRVPNKVVRPASKNGCDFVQPVVKGSVNYYLTGAVSASATTFALFSVTGLEIGMVCLVDSSGELVRVENIVASTITVKRGYNGTTATGHSINDWVYPMLPGPNTVAQASPVANLCLPLVFARGSQDKGCHEVTEYALGRSVSNYADSVSAIECWVGGGPSLSIVQAWRLRNDTTTIDDITGVIATYNDWDNGATGVSGTKLVAGGAILAGTNDHHLAPHPIPSGTYFIHTPFYNAASPVLAWVSGKNRFFVLLQGLTDDGTPPGNPHRYPSGIMQAFIVNPDWGLGLTLADYVVSGRITGWNSGDWQDEYSESWAEVIEGAVPEFGASESPFVLDVLHELADVISSDLFIRDGKLYPTRREVAGTADLTIEADHLGDGAWPTRVKDPQAIYCNRLTAQFGQELLTEAHDADDYIPVRIPYTMTFDDYTEQAAQGVVEKYLTRRWFRMWLSNTYPVHDSTAHSMDYLEHWDDSQKIQFDMRSQPQVWIESDLCETCAFFQQGDSIDYNITGITTRIGQVRGIRKQRGRSSDGIRPPIGVHVRSWHINF